MIYRLENYKNEYINIAHAYILLQSKTGLVQKASKN